MLSSRSARHSRTTNPARRPLQRPFSAMVSAFILLLVLTSCGAPEEDSTSEAQVAAQPPAPVAPPPVPTTVAPPPDPQTAPPSPQADPVELELWRSVKDTDDPAELEAYLEQYPEGAFAARARTRMGSLREN